MGGGGGGGGGRSHFSRSWISSSPSWLGSNAPASGDSRCSTQHCRPVFKLQLGLSDIIHEQICICILLSTQTEEQKTCRVGLGTRPTHSVVYIATVHVSPGIDKPTRLYNCSWNMTFWTTVLVHYTSHYKNCSSLRVYYYSEVVPSYDTWLVGLTRMS